MPPEIDWTPIVLFLSALAVYALIAHLRRPRVARRHRGFQNMKSPVSRARRRARRNVPNGSNGDM